MSKKLTLKSSDGEDFVVEESVAVRSQTIKSMVEDGCTSDNPIPVPNVGSMILALVIEYCKKHALAETEAEAEAADIKAFDAESFDKDQSVLCDLILAANFLNIVDWLKAGCQKIADMMKGKSTDEIRRTFYIKNDYTPEEEAEVRRENAWAFGK